MTGGGNSAGSRPVTTTEAPDDEASPRIAETTEEVGRDLTSIQDELARIEFGLANAGQIDAAALERLTRLAGHAQELCAGLNAGMAGIRSGRHSPSDREESPARRRRSGVRCVVSIDIWDHDVAALIAGGDLAPKDAGRPDRIAEAVEEVLERRLHGRRPERSASVAPKPEIDTETPSETTAPQSDEPIPDRRLIADRRSGQDRRRPKSAVGKLLGMIEGTSLDRRFSGDRRSGLDRRDFGDDTATRRKPDR